MRLIVSGFSLLLFTLASPIISLAEEKSDVSSVCRSDLPTAITEIINRPEFERSRWGIEIQTLEEEKTLFSLNGNMFFTPASSLKLLTSAASLIELGTDYRIETTIYSTGTAPNLTSLRLEGQGDPTISTETLNNIVHQLQSRGIKRIENLIIEDSYFAPPSINPTWEWLDVHSYFATAVNSTILNQNTVTLTLLPQQIGQPVKHYWSDAIAARQWQLDNQAVTGNRDIDYNIELDSYLGTPKLQLRGELAVNEPPDVWELAVVDPAQYFLESFRFQLTDAGITVGKGTVINQPEQNQGETELMTIYSPPMQQILEEVNQESNNLYAEVLGKILAKKLGSETATEAVKSSLNTIGINPNEYVLADVSGLSRQNLISPQMLVKTLRIMSQLSQRESYRQSLALASINGTLKNRFRNSSITGNLWGKTGTLTGIGTLSGYIIDHQNPSIVFSILINNSELKSNEIRQAVDEIIVILNQLNKC